MGQCQIYIAIALLGFINSVSCQDFSLNLISRVPEGIPGVDYPAYTSVPRRLSFNCRDRKPGFYADPETRCQVWHWCDTFNIKHSFICSNMTLFNQKIRGCDWWYNVDCDLATSQYSNNDELYQTAKPHEQSDQERRHAQDDAQRRQKQLEDDAAASAAAAATAANTLIPDQSPIENNDGFGSLPANNAHQPLPESATFDVDNNVHQQPNDISFTSTFASDVQPLPIAASVAPVVHQFVTTSPAPRGFQQVRPLTNRFPGSPNNFVANIPNAIPIAFPPPPAPRPTVNRAFVQPEVAPISTTANANLAGDVTSGLSTLTAEDNLLANDFNQVVTNNNGHTDLGSFSFVAHTPDQPATSTVQQQQQPEVFSEVTNIPEVTVRQRVPSARGRPGIFQGPFFSSSTAPPTVAAPIHTTTTPSPSSVFDFGVHVDPVTNRIFNVAQNNNNNQFNSVAPPIAETGAPFVPSNHFITNQAVTNPAGGLFTTSANFNSHFDDDLVTQHDDLNDANDNNDDDDRDFQRFNSVPPVPFFGGQQSNNAVNELSTHVTEPAAPTTINLDQFFADTAPLSPSSPPPPPPPPTPRQSQFRPFSARGTAPPRHQASFRPTFHTSPPPTTVITSTTSQPSVITSSSHQPQLVEAQPAVAPVVAPAIAPAPASFDLVVPFGARLRHVVARDPSNGLDQSATVRRHDSSASSSTKRSAVDLASSTQSDSSTTSRQIVVRSSITSATTTTTAAPPATTITTTTTPSPPSTSRARATTEFDNANSLPSTVQPLRRRKLITTTTTRGATFPPFRVTTSDSVSSTLDEAETENTVEEVTDAAEIDITTTVAPPSAKSLLAKRRKILRTTTTAAAVTQNVSTTTETNELDSSSSLPTSTFSAVRNASATDSRRISAIAKIARTTAAASTLSSRSSPAKRRTFPSFPITTFRPSTPFQLQSRGRVVDGHFGERKKRPHTSTTVNTTESSTTTTDSFSNNDVTQSR